MASQPLATREDSPLVAFKSNLAKRADEFKMALPGHISPEKFQRTVLTAVQSNPKLLDADRASLYTSCMKAAQDGLLPDGREAALVMFSNRVNENGTWVSVDMVQYMPMVYGLRKKILQSGEISSISCNVVYRQEAEAGAFIYEEGTDRTLRHRPMLDIDVGDDDIIAAYSIAVMKDGTQSFEVMRRSEINKVRQTSKTGAVGMTDYKKNPKPPKGPWVDWFGEMAKKTVMRRHSKSLPMSGDIIDVEAMDDTRASESTVAMFDAAGAPVPPRRLAVVGDTVDVKHDPVTGEIDDDLATKTDEEDQAKSEVTAEAKPDGKKGAGRKPVAESKPAAEESDAGQPAKIDHEAAFDALKARIESADNVIALKRAIDAIPDDLPDGWQSTLRTRGAEQHAELRKPK